MAFENGDVTALTALLREDVALEMPPHADLVRRPGARAPLPGHEAVRTPGQFRLVPTMANGQPAFAAYERGRDGVYRAHAALVLTVTATGIARIVIFLSPGLLGAFGLPQEYGVARPRRIPPPPPGPRPTWRSRRGPADEGTGVLGWAVSYALASASLATPQRLPGPTPCAGWDLGLLLHHVSDSVGVLHEAVATGCIGSGPPAEDEEPEPDVVTGLYRRAAGCWPPAPRPPRPGTWSPLVTGNCLRRWPWPPGPSSHGPWLGHLGRVRQPQAGPAGPGGSLAADRPAVHHSRRPGGIVRRPGPGARAGLPGDQLVAFLGRQPQGPDAPGRP